MSHAVMEQVAKRLDQVITRLVPLTKVREEIPKAAAKQELRELVAELRDIRSGMRIRVRNPNAERRTSEFNLFVRETMRELRDQGIVFPSTTERMKECGRRWNDLKLKTSTTTAPLAP